MISLLTGICPSRMLIPINAKPLPFLLSGRGFLCFFLLNEVVATNECLHLESACDAVLLFEVDDIL